MRYDRQAERREAYIRALRLLLIWAVLWVVLKPLAADAAVVINEGSRTFEIRRGTTLVERLAQVDCPADQPSCDRVVLSIVAAEANLRGRVTNPWPTPTRTYQVRTGSGIGIVSPTTLEQCRQIPRDRLTAEGQTRTSGGNVLSCQVKVKYSNAVDAPFLLVTLNYIGSFKPGTPPVEPTTLPAPTGVTVTVLSTRALRWQWNVVADSLAYQWEYCRGDGCTNFAAATCTSSLSVDHDLALNATARFRVRASRSRDCSTGLGTWSAAIQGTTVIPVDPNQPQAACNGLVCRVTWNQDGPTVEYTRVWWARTEGTLGAEIANSARTQGSERELVITMPSGGVWFFGAKAFIGPTSSGMSNVISRTVQ